MKRLLIIATILLLVATTASAFMFPLPISGKVSGTTVAGIEIVVTNVRTSDYEIVRTNAYGEFMSDASNYPDGYRNGDTFEIQITECKDNPECVHTATFVSNTETPIIFVSFDITGLFCPKDITPYGNCDSCCEVVTCECEECVICEECPETAEEYSWELIVALLAGVGAVGIFLGKKVFSKEEQTELQDKLGENLSVGSGFRVFRSTNKTLLKHLHYGRVGYHDPQTTHRNPKYKHERGKLIV